MQEAQDLFPSLKFLHTLGLEEGKKELKTVTIDDREFLVVPNGLQLTDLEKYRDTPDRVKAEHTFIDIPSFADYVERFKTPGTTLFASMGSRTIRAELDYHDGPEGPAWRTHKATLSAVATPEWTKLMKVDGSFMSQNDFADLLEELDHIFIDPDAAKIAEIAMNLKGSVNAVFESKINRANSTVQLAFKEEMETGNLKVPEQAQLSLYPYHFCDLTDVRVLIRFRISSGRPFFALKIPNIEKIEQDILKSLFEKVEEKTGLAVLVGP